MNEIIPIQALSIINQMDTKIPRISSDILGLMADSFVEEYQKRYNKFNPEMKLEFDVFEAVLEKLQKSLKNSGDWKNQIRIFPSPELHSLSWSIRAKHHFLKTEIEVFNEMMFFGGYHRGSTVIQYLEKLEHYLELVNERINEWNKFCSNVKPFFYEELPKDFILYHLNKELHFELTLLRENGFIRSGHYEALDQIPLSTFEMLVVMSEVFPYQFGDWSLSINYNSVMSDDGVLEIHLEHPHVPLFILDEVSINTADIMFGPIIMEFLETLLTRCDMAMFQWNLFLEGVNIYEPSSLSIAE